MSEREEGPELRVKTAEKPAETEKNGEEKDKTIAVNGSTVINTDTHHILSR
jgi:hypothetical protein